jgi:Fe-S-cluster containining protein
MSVLDNQPNFAIAKQRADEFVKSVPKEIFAQEAALPEKLRNLNASKSVKLRKVYQLADEFSRLMAPYIACTNGCSHCCHHGVEISSLEATSISNFSGRAARPIQKTIMRKDDPYRGSPCPFLVQDSCSVYEVRPLVCRNHVSYDATNTACLPTHIDEDRPMLRFGGLLNAWIEVSSKQDNFVVADIRDFFN